MISSNLVYTQKVNADGYRWENVFVPRLGMNVLGIVEGENPALAGLGPFSDEYWAVLDEMWQQADIETSQTREYVPEHVPDLYRTFASTSATGDGSLRFVNRHGRLGIAEPIPVDEVTNPDGSVWRDYKQVECAHAWVREIRLMKSCVDILDLVDNPFKPDKRALARLFIYRNGQWCVKSNCLPGYTKQGRVEHVNLGIWADNPDAFKAIRPDDVLGVATEFLRAITDCQLSGRVTASVVRGSDGEGPALVFKPTSLLGAVWLQFAKVMTHTDNTRACLECGKMFEFQRRTKLFCGEACQKKFNRKRARASSQSSVGGNEGSD